MLKSLLFLFQAILAVFATAALAGEDAWFHEVNPISGNWHITVSSGDDEGVQSGTLSLRPTTTTVCILVDGGSYLFRLRHEVSG